ncbi:type II toxin-antitoxin system VapC family toxin [Methylosinus sp. 3S-1]|uniref:PIN domain-containing protein n=1 Tax=Methylosinus trichosporium (strain ATCC 35070 / NCIMB 11131 / UNIQEM 75 / OB3b) TaxID=595536 RepID=A0A2D2D4K4_METT3|nr:PIN domain-containing protein [Methylosinus trichosporium OB3b]
MAALTLEARTAQIQSWLYDPTPGSLAISEWTVAEFSSALSIKLRTGAVDAALRADALAALARLCSDSFALLPITSNEFHTATRFVDQFALGLRAGDALHLAVSAAHGATLCTLDKRLAEAGPPLGVSTLIP